MNTFDTTIIISRYNESLSWILDSPFQHIPTIIYNKGPNDDFTTHESVIATHKLPNVGREGHTYLYHIIQNYDNLPEITIFLPGSCNSDYKYSKALDTVNNIQNTKNTFFCNNNNMDVYETYKDFYLDEYSCTEPSNYLINNDTMLTPATIRPFGKWYNYHFGNNRTMMSSSHGIFAIHKNDILKQPKSYYEVFLRELETSSNPEEIHYYERAWGAIFGIFSKQD